MTRHAAVAACMLALLAAGAAGAEQILALKNGSFIKVESYEVSGERVMLTTADGNLFTLPLSSIDFEQSKLLSKTLTEQTAEQKAAAQREAERVAASERVARLAVQRSRLGLVEASERYGVDQPGMSVVQGRPTAPSAPRQSAPARKSETSASAPSSPAITAAEADLERMEERQAALARQVDQLSANTNPNPLLAASREDMLGRFQRQLDDQNRRIAQARQRLERLKQQEAAKQKKKQQQREEDAEEE